MDKDKLQDFTSLINRLYPKTLSFSVLKSLLEQVALSLFQDLEALMSFLAAIGSLLPVLEPPTHHFLRWV
jgi:hypothetical protein